MGLNMTMTGMVLVQQMAINVLVIVLQLQVDDRRDMVYRVARVQLVRPIILKYEWTVE